MVKLGDLSIDLGRDRQEFIAQPEVERKITFEAIVVLNVARNQCLPQSPSRVGSRIERPEARRTVDEKVGNRAEAVRPAVQIRISKLYCMRSTLPPTLIE
jgi:hypothetical protein